MLEITDLDAPLLHYAIATRLRQEPEDEEEDDEEEEDETQDDDDFEDDLEDEEEDDGYSERSFGGWVVDQFLPKHAKVV